MSNDIFELDIPLPEESYPSGSPIVGIPDKQIDLTPRVAPSPVGEPKYWVIIQGQEGMPEHRFLAVNGDVRYVQVDQKVALELSYVKMLENATRGVPKKVRNPDGHEEVQIRQVKAHSFIVLGPVGP